MASDKWFKWTVEFQVHQTWVEDGFDLTNERALEMLSNDLAYASESELKAEVTLSPNPKSIAKTQGYKSLADKLKKESKA